MTDQANVISLKINRLIEMFPNENYLGEPRTQTSFKSTIINFIREFKESKEHSKKQLSEIKVKDLRENKGLMPKKTQIQDWSK